MEAIATLLIFVVGLPAMIGGVLFLIWKFLGGIALRIVAGLIVIVCIDSLIKAANAPPVYGNKSALIAVADFLTVTLLLANSLILFWPLVRRFLAWDENRIRNGEFVEQNCKDQS